MLQLKYFTYRLEDQIDVSERLFDTYPILIYPCRIYDTGLGQLRAPRKGNYHQMQEWESQIRRLDFLKQLKNIFQLSDQMTPDSNFAMFNDLGVYGVPKKVRNKER